YSVFQSKSTLPQKSFMVKGCTSFSCPGLCGAHSQTPGLRRAVHSLSVPIQKPFVLWSNSYWGGGKYGIGAESVTGQEAGATRVCCWALAVKASNEINTAIRKTVIARSSFKS